ncbi:phosphoenolpyruvate--protein phosphotransferase [Cellulomonas sp. KRMCY2]|uniref:phosphoenolpyruvate--protein phosphotransferase n=1 Tax=Cellulomonas sp. KRMCY2 TaxID=1304865 RepID=UPI0004A33545|nr:phosphoenolpyruvate--protein phosphotransferase [Cellulomonas sp. KRMCY2]
MATDTAAPPITRLSLTAPVTGVLVPIEKVPDPVFAQKMVGEGISIDPVSNELLAPCDGEVIHIHPAKHAVSIRAAGGLEVLLHIGLDTVKMRGEGFEVRVAVGDQVQTGAPLIVFDLDMVATSAKSVLTQMVITNSDLLSTFRAGEGFVTAGQDEVAEAVMAAPPGEGVAVAVGRTVTSDAVVVPNPVGLHARPAAVLSKLAQGYASDIRIKRGEDQANAKSVMAIMGLEVSQGDKVQIIAHGPDAAEAVHDLTTALRDGLGEEGVVPIVEALLGEVEPQPAAAPAVRARPRSDDPNLLLGVAASPGLAIGKTLRVVREDIEVKEEASDRHRERRILNDATDRALVQLGALESRLEQDADPDKAAIFAAHREILRDPDLLDIASSAIDKGKTAAFAWRAAYTLYADRLAGLKNELLAGRATDVRDVGRRVLEEVTGQRHEKPEIPEGTILVAEDLTPSDTASLDRTRVVGFCTAAGGASSHVAIIARSLDIPAVAGIEPRAMEIPDGSLVILDGAKGTLRTNVTEDEVARIRRHQERTAERRAEDLLHAEEPATTTDGHHLEVVANIGGLEDAQNAMTKGAEGVGLLRSEFIFLGRTTAPSEDEQAQIYTDIAEALRPGQPLVIRTLDVGGDKPLPYLPIPPEENPFLGVRGVRVGLDRPEILRSQVRAILRAAGSGAKVSVMFPMISTIDDFRQAKEIFEEEREKLGVPPVPVGIMVEVPSVAVMAAQFAAEVDFFSVGTNDLTQYTLAMDRGHPKLAPQVDGLNPAVLGLIGLAATAARAAGKWVGVCGGIASDPQAVPILVGLGVDELSVSIPAIPAVKAQIRALSLVDCQELAARALTQVSAAAVRALVPTDDDD